MRGIYSHRIKRALLMPIKLEVYTAMYRIFLAWLMLLIPIRYGITSSATCSLKTKKTIYGAVVRP